jgi:hypothetical protein
MAVYGNIERLAHISGRAHISVYGKVGEVFAQGGRSRIFIKGEVGLVNTMEGGLLRAEKVGEVFGMYGGRLITNSLNKIRHFRGGLIKAGKYRPITTQYLRK